jgi:hypothetical protein
MLASASTDQLTLGTYSSYITSTSNF